MARKIGLAHTRHQLLRPVLQPQNKALDKVDDFKVFLDVVLEMRAAQKLEMDALPSNLKIWKSARQ